MRPSVRLTIATILLLLIAVCAEGFLLMNFSGERYLTVSFLDIGQGDAVFIHSPRGRQILIDGGAGPVVLRRLATVMPWYDHSIDMVIGTHPDSDHIGGLIDVLPRYSVGTILFPSVQGDTPAWGSYTAEVAKQQKHGTRVVIAQRGQVFSLGGGVYLEVLSPDRAVPGLETNTGCIVTRLVYGKTSFMLPCDAPQAIENYLAQLDGPALHSDVLKAGHHGSKTSSSRFFVGFVDPEYVVYSRGCNNKYGHPSPETIETYTLFNIPTFDTCKEGTITFESDGKTVKKI